jgi:hypothetical protein
MVVGAAFNLKAPLKVLKSVSLEVSLAPLLNTKDDNTALLSACNTQEWKQQGTSSETLETTLTNLYKRIVSLAKLK